MKAKQKRLMFVVIGMALLGAAVYLVLNALNSNIALFYTPTQVAADEAPTGHTFRIGGLVEEGSLRREKDGLTVHFSVTDNAESIHVTYKGILPDLFREGQGVVAQGKLGENGIFTASEVLAKHDENYMPPEVADALEKTKKNEAAKTAPATAQ